MRDIFNVPTFTGWERFRYEAYMQELTCILSTMERCMLYEAGGRSSDEGAV